MSTRARLARSVIAIAAIAICTSACNTTKLDSGTQGLAMTFKPDPGGMNRLNGGTFEAGNFDIVKLQVLPVDPNTAQVYGIESLILKLDRVQEDLALGEVPFSQIALPTGTYIVTNLVITKPAFVDHDIPIPVPTDPALCMAGVTSVNAENVGAFASTSFDQSSNITFTVSPGQTSLAIRLNVPAFTQAYESCFACQVGCGTNDPNHNCLRPPFNEAAFRTAVLANLTIR